MFDFACDYICGMVLTFLAIIFFMGANQDQKS